MEKEVTFVRMDPMVKQRLMKLAAADGRSLSSLIAKITADWLRDRKPPKAVTENRHV